MYSIGPLRPSVPTIELDAGAIAAIPIPLTRGQTIASASILSVATPTMAVGPHFINVALSPDSDELERVRIKNLITKIGRRANSLELAMDLCQVFRHIFLRIFINFFKLRLRSCYKY